MYIKCGECYQVMITTLNYLLQIACILYGAMCTNRWRRGVKIYIVFVPSNYTFGHPINHPTGRNLTI